MDTLTIMISKAKVLKNKIKLFLSKGYRIKVGKNSYMLFKKEEDYEILIYLERVFFDLFKNILFINDEHKEIRVFFRLSLIENYVKRLPEIKIKILYDKNKCKNSFVIRFPNIRLIDYSELEDEIWENLDDLQNKDLEYKYIDFTDILKDVISVNYYKKICFITTLLINNNSFNKQQH